MAEWRKTRCVDCRGFGQVSAYTVGGTDFLGATECEVCGGNGVVWVSDRDRVALYPGGPFLGSDPGAFARAGAVERQEGR